MANSELPTYIIWLPARTDAPNLVQRVLAIAWSVVILGPHFSIKALTGINPAWPHQHVVLQWLFRSTFPTQPLNARVPLEFAVWVIDHSNPVGVKIIWRLDISLVNWLGKVRSKQWRKLNTSNFTPENYAHLWFVSKYPLSFAAFNLGRCIILWLYFLSQRNL